MNKTWLCAKCQKKKTIQYKSFNNLCCECLPDDRRCTRITRKGTRCRLPSLPEKDYCRNHARVVQRPRGKRCINRKEPRGRKRSKQGYVYIIDLGRESYYKIGLTRNGDQRLAAMQSSNPWARFIFCEAVLHASNVEKQLHWMFRDQNIEREIFCLTKDDLEKAREYIGEHNHFLPPSKV